MTNDLGLEKKKKTKHSWLDSGAIMGQAIFLFPF